MKQFNEVFPHLDAKGGGNPAMIGLEVRYNVPTNPFALVEFLRRNGTLALGRFQIVGYQLDFRGELCYRVVGLDFNDSFGRCVSMDEVSIVQ